MVRSGSGKKESVKGETRDFIFRKIRQRDLKNPHIAIPMGIRWLIYKSKRAEAKLGRPPTHEELILEYKGLLRSKSAYKKAALKKYLEAYERRKE